jgi:ligand-binding SRPBCC domain-containing protein
MSREFVLREEIAVTAPIERCFLLSTSLAIVQRELGMRPVRGRTTGLVTGGDSVRWQGWQMGLPQYHESLIEAFDPPVFFRDRMIDGRFRTFEHDHRFTDHGNGMVVLADELRFTMPLGWPGEMVGRWIMVPHIRGLMGRRFRLLKRIAESEEWRQYLEPAAPGIPSTQSPLSHSPEPPDVTAGDIRSPLPPSGQTNRSG